MMRVIARKTLRDFWEAGHADAEGPLSAWFAEAERAVWNSCFDVEENGAQVKMNMVRCNDSLHLTRLVCDDPYGRSRRAST